MRQWQDKYQPEVRKKLEQNVKVSNDHLERPEFIRFAIDTARNGKASFGGINKQNGHNRWVYQKDYTSDEREFTMFVVTEQMGKKRRSVITFYDSSEE